MCFVPTQDARALATVLGEAALAAAGSRTPCDACGAVRRYTHARVREGHSLVEVASSAPALWPGSAAWLRAADAAAASAADAAARIAPGYFSPSLYRELFAQSDVSLFRAHGDHRVWTTAMAFVNGFSDGAVF